MKKLFFLFALFFLLSSGNIYPQWSWQNPLPQGNWLLDLSFVNANTGYACGRGGTIIKTTDAGNVWVILPYFTYNDIACMCFINESTGIVSLGGANGTISKTTNGGINFFVVSDNTTTYFYNIVFTDYNNGWAGGNLGVILHTSNGGNNWITQQSGVSGDITGLSFINSNTGYACVWNLGEILKTTNGGNNWVIVCNDGAKHYQSIFFINELTGWATGFEGLVRKTTNGGINWVNISDPNFGGYIFDIKFLNTNTGWVTSGNMYAGHPSAILKTTNGGGNWFSQTIYNPMTEWYLRIQIIDSNNIWAVGESGLISKTNAGNNSWSLKSKGTTLDIRNINFVGPNNAFAVCNSFYDCLVISTSDGGGNWNSVSTINKQMLAIKFINNNTGFLVGNGGNILKTENAGNNWVKYPISDSANSLIDVKFIDENTGWICNTNGVIYKTINCGNNWNAITLDTAYYFFRINFCDYNNGWGVGYFPYILKTSNGGNSWLKIPSGFSRSLKDVFFIDNNTGWAVGDSAVVLKSTNSGNNWQRVWKSSINYTLFTVKFINPNTGFACGTTGPVIKTTNGGVNWFSIHPPNLLNRRLNDLSFINEMTGWIIGDGGLILKTTNGGNTFIYSNISTIPNAFKLEQNYPNPFNPVTKIRFEVPLNKVEEPPWRWGKGVVSLRVYDILGREVATVVNEQLQSGTYEVTFDGTNYPSGIYFYKLQTTDFSESKKMLMIK